MANDNFDLPRPTDPVPSATSAVINDDAKVLDYLINSNGTVTTRTGKVLLTIDEATKKFGFGIAPFTFTTGGTLISLNLLVSNSPTDGYLYKYVGSGSAPITVTAGTNPVGNPDWVAQAATSAEFINYNPSLSLLTRSVSSKLDDVVSIINYIPVNVNPEDTNTDCSIYILNAIASLSGNTYEKSRGLYFPGGIYNCKSTILITLAQSSSLTFYSDTKATLVAGQPAGEWLIDVDYSTGGNANFKQFNMIGMALSSPYAPFDSSRNGIRMKRVIGSQFERCDFNYLNVAVDMFDDSNLNKFTLCQWRGNVNGWKSSGGIANNNVFDTCQFRYHSGTAFDSTGTDGNMFIGGDLEPENASPVVIAHNMKMKGVRYERNASNGLAGTAVYDNNELDIECNSDGATQVLPLFDVYGSGNDLTANGSGASAARIHAGAKRNTVRIRKFNTLVSPAGLVYSCDDAEKSNVLVCGTSAQSNSGISEAFASELVPADLSLWTATDCTVTTIAGGQRVTVTGANPSLKYSPPAGDYSEINVSVVSTASNAVSQALMQISGSVVPTEIELGNGWPANYAARRLIATLSGRIYTNPEFTITVISPVNGTSFDISGLRTSSVYTPG